METLPESSDPGQSNEWSHMMIWIWGEKRATNCAGFQLKNLQGDGYFSKGLRDCHSAIEKG